MPKAIQNKPYFSFVGGLVTEATGLTYPEGTAQDLLNLDLNKSGKVSKRLGLFPELGLDVQSLGLGTGDSTNDAITMHSWPSPGGDDTKHFVLIQHGRTIFLRDILNGDLGEPLSFSGGVFANVNSSTTLVQTWASASTTAVAGDAIQTAVGRDRLFVVGRYLEPFFLEYDKDANRVDVTYVGEQSGGTQSKIKIRDFNGIDDGLEVDEEPTTLTKERTYNLFNQGWAGNPQAIIDYYIATGGGSGGRYPSNAQQWIIAKDADDNFNASLLTKQDFGTSRAPKGRTLIDALRGGRDVWLTGSVNLSVTLGLPPTENELIDFSGAQDEPALDGGSFRTVCFQAGRLWLSGDNNPKRPNGVYFSQVINNIEDAGKMHQSDDPTSEHFNELLDNDGGVIYIPEATQIVKIIPLVQGVLVLADNGVWFIRGGESGFLATDFSVDKLGPMRVTSPLSVVEFEGGVAFWADSGIYIVTSPDGLLAKVDKVSEGIETFYNDIDPTARRNVWGVYDALSEKIHWMYFKGETYSPSIRNAILTLNLELVAFEPHLTAVGDGNSYGIGAAIATPNRIKRKTYLTSTTVQEIDEDVESNLKFWWFDYSASNRGYVLEMSTEFYVDFHGPTILENYDAYLETGAEHAGDISRNKQATSVYSYFEVVERFALNNLAGDTIIYPQASCLATFKWDWHRSGNGGRWSNPQQAYRRRRPITTTKLDNGEGIVYTKLRARGKGKALSIRYEGEFARDFRLLGFNVEFTA